MSDAMQRDTLRQYVQAFGKKKSATVLSVLGKGQAFIDAASSQIGQEILGEAQSEWANMLRKIAKREATDEEKIKFEVLDSLLTLWVGKIAKHFQYEMAVEEKLSSVDSQSRKGPR